MVPRRAVLSSIDWLLLISSFSSPLHCSDGATHSTHGTYRSAMHSFHTHRQHCIAVLQRVSL